MLPGVYSGGRWRFGGFLRGVGATQNCARAVVQRREPHFLGHSPLFVLHVAGVVFTSIRQKENLAAAMVHGRKRVPAEASPD